MKKTSTRFFKNSLTFLALLVSLSLSKALSAQDASIAVPFTSFASPIVVNSAAYNQVEFSQTNASFSSSSYTNCSGFTTGNTLRIGSNTAIFDINTANSTLNKIQIRIQANGTSAANGIVGFSADGTTWTNFSELAAPATNAVPSCESYELVAPAGAKYFRMQRVAFGGYTPVGSTGATVRVFEVFVFVNSLACTSSTLFDVTGSATICSGTTNVSLSGSQSGATYQLYKDNIASGPGKTGTGGILTWEVASSGIYTVKITTDAGYCAADMNGMADIKIGGGVPSITSQSTAGATYVEGATAAALTVVTPSDLFYQWYSNNSASNTGGISVGSANGGQTSSFTPATDIVGTTYYYCVVSSPCGADAVSNVSGAIVVQAAPNVTGMRFGADFTGSPSSYMFSTTDVLYPTASSFSTSSSNLCSGSLRRTQVTSVILELVSTSAQSIVVHGTSSGSSLRSLVSIDTSSTLAGTYEALTPTTNSTITSSACGILEITGINIRKGSFVKLTFNGNVNLGGFDVTPTLVVLPLSLVSARAVQQGSGIYIDWKTVNEQGLRNFEIEKSTDGRQFSKSTTVLAQNNGSASYNWFDANPANGKNYYRIKAVSQNGEANYSQVLALVINNGVAGISLYPNPVTGNRVGLQFNHLAKGQYELQLYNNMGQKVMSKMIDHTGGSASETLYFDNTLGKGIYRVSLLGKDGSRLNQSLVIQ